MARSATPDFYELLGVTRDADAATITRAYRKLAKMSHPDGGGNAGMFRLLRAAYETLTDEEERRQYDATLLELDNGLRPTEQTSQMQSPDKVDPEPCESEEEGATSRPSSSLLVDPERLEWWANAPSGDSVVAEPSYARGRWPAVGAIAVLIALGVWMAFVHFFAAVALVAAAVTLAGIHLSASRGADVRTLIGAATVVTLTGCAVFMYTASSLVGLLLGLGFLLVFVVAVVFTRWYGLVALIDRLAPRDAVEQYEYGQPGAAHRAHSPGGEAEVADRVGADALLSLALIPGVRVFHSLVDPSNEEPISHAVVCGERIALVRSRYWPAGSYSWSPHGALMRDGEPVTAPGADLDTAVAVYRRSLGEAVEELRGYLLVTPPDGAPVIGGNGPTGVMLGAAQDVVNDIGNWFLSSGGAAVVDRRLLIKLYDHRAVIGGSDE